MSADENANSSTNVRLSDEEKKIFELIQEGRTTEVLGLLESENVRINCLDESGMNFLDQAAFKGDERLVERLIERGADADNRNHGHGYTCLMFAALSGKARVCELLLNAGARSYATNKLGKTAAEMAAFVGNFECVSLINSYISHEDVEKLVHPNGSKSEQLFPPAFVDHIHELTRTHHIHPVAIARGLAARPVMLQFRKKLLYVVDRLFERQLRSKEPNEIMALKLWLVLASLREIVAFVNKTIPEASPFDEEACVQQVHKFVKTIAEWKQADCTIGRRKLEAFLTSATGGFPYQHSVVYKALAQSFKNLRPGRAPNPFVLICGTVFGQRFAQSAFCSLCGQANAPKCCSNCKVIYCSSECQRADWPSHKKVCDALRSDPEQNAYLTPNPPDVSYLDLNDKQEEEAGKQPVEEKTE